MLIYNKITEKKRELNSLVKKVILIEAEIKQVQGNLNSLAEQKKELKTKLADVMDTSAEDNDFDISGEEFKRKIKRVELKLQDLNKMLKEISENNHLDLEAHEKHDKLAQKLRETKKSMEVVQTQARKSRVVVIDEGFPNMEMIRRRAASWNFQVWRRALQNILFFHWQD